MSDINEVRERLEKDVAGPLTTYTAVCARADLRALLADHARLNELLGNSEQLAPAIDLGHFRRLADSWQEQAERVRALAPDKAIGMSAAAKELRDLLAKAVRHQPAPAIDLGPFRELLNQWKGSEYPLSYEGQHSQRALNACIADLQALIDGQARCQTCGTAIKSHPLTGTICDCAMQPTKGEGVAGE